MDQEEIERLFLRLRGYAPEFAERRIAKAIGLKLSKGQPCLGRLMSINRSCDGSCPGVCTPPCVELEGVRCAAFYDQELGRIVLLLLTVPNKYEWPVLRLIQAVDRIPGLTAQTNGILELNALSYRRDCALVSLFEPHVLEQVGWWKNIHVQR